LPPLYTLYYKNQIQTKNGKLSLSVSACRYFIDKLVRAVEKDADFVISSSSAYKGTTELERAKSVKTSDFFGGFLVYSF